MNYTNKKGNYLIEVDFDNDPYSPRENDNITTMICFHKRYNLGDKHDLKSDMFDSWQEVIQHIKDTFKVLAWKYLHLYDHSGITISTSEFGDRFDSGIVGIVFVDEDKSKALLGEVITDKDKLDKIIESEVNEYDTYIRGEVYQYKIYEVKTCNLGCEHTELIESCCGFYDESHCIEEAEAIVDNLIGAEAEIVE